MTMATKRNTHGDLHPTTATLLGAMFNAPLIAVSRRWPTVAHAVTMPDVVDGWKRGTFSAACGKSGLRLVGTRSSGIGLWPPRVQGCPYVRCRECWIATGKKRPRSEWQPK